MSLKVTALVAVLASILLQTTYALVTIKVQNNCTDSIMLGSQGASGPSILVQGLEIKSQKSLIAPFFRPWYGDVMIIGAVWYDMFLDIHSSKAGTTAYSIATDGENNGLQIVPPSPCETLTCGSSCSKDGECDQNGVYTIIVCATPPSST